MTARPVRILLLGGTTEAIALAADLSGDPRLEVTSSLAGRTAGHRQPPGRVRLGGFGGPEGLAAWLRREGTDLLIDATHPFAATIARNAALAGAATGLPRVKIVRPGWQAAPGDRWHRVPTLAAAASLLAGRAGTVFLTVGRQELAAFAGVAGPSFLVRMIEPPAEPLPLAGCRVILGRGPFSVAEEADLLEREAVELLVTKDSGGDATFPKLIAARRAGIPVIMVDRPAMPEGETVASVAEARRWVEAKLAAPSA